MLDIDGFLTSSEFLFPLATIIAQLLTGFFQMLLGSWLGT